MRTPVAIALALTAAAPSSLLAANFAIRVDGDRVSVRAVAAPLPEVLEALAREAGMDVVWGLSPPPRPLVTIDLAGALLSEAVPAILGELRFNYALGLSSSGRRVRALHIVNARPPAPTDPSVAQWPAPFGARPLGPSP